MEKRENEQKRENDGQKYLTVTTSCTLTKKNKPTTEHLTAAY